MNQILITEAQKLQSNYSGTTLFNKLAALGKRHNLSVFQVQQQIIECKAAQASEAEKRGTYVQVFRKEYDAPERRQLPLPLDIAYKTALYSLQNNTSCLQNQPL